MILAVLLIPSLVFIVVLTLRKSQNKIGVLTFASILAVSSVLYQLCTIAWHLIEDGVLLNIGSVTGVTSATTLFVALLVQRQLFKEMGVQEEDI